MKTFDQAFFNELAAFDDLAFAKVPPRDGFRPCVAELHAAGKISDAFFGLTRDFVHTFAVRSRGRYQNNVTSWTKVESTRRRRISKDHRRIRLCRC